MNKKERDLGNLGAIWNAFWNKSISFFPRSIVGPSGEIQRIDELKILEDISAVLSRINAEDGVDIKAYLERGRESLDEVKALTQYQDQKATNLLTIIAFLTALAGALFTKFVDIYPIHAVKTGWEPGWQQCLVGLSYVLFALFVMSAVSGALIIFHATRTLFKYPKAHPFAQTGTGERTRSYLFVNGIVATPPALWAASFIRSDGIERTGEKEETIQIDPALQLNYFKNYIAESYLVACKVADKIRYLQPGQAILSISIRILLIWIVLTGATWVFVNPTQPESSPSQTQVVKPQATFLINDKPGKPEPSLATPTNSSNSK